MRCPGLLSSVLAALLPLATAHWTQAASHQPLASESYLSDTQSAGQCPQLTHDSAKYQSENYEAHRTL